MAEFFVRMFTPSNSDRSGMVGNSNSRPAAPKAPKAPQPKKAAEKTVVSKSRSRFGGIAKKKQDDDKSTKKMLLGG